MQAVQPVHRPVSDDLVVEVPPLGLLDGHGRKS